MEIESEVQSSSEPTAFGLDRFQVIRVLGQGGFGITYQAFDQVLQRTVAIKEFFLHGSKRIGNDVVLPDDFSLEIAAQFRQGFLEEARALARFNDAGVVKVNEIFEENQTSYIVMEFIEGQTLHDYAATQNGLSVSEVMRLAKLLLRSLGRVHRADLLHRDIKPQNIYVTSEGQPVLLDFGAARSIQSSRDATEVLTHHFAPIEQYTRDVPLGTYTDIYALAASLVSTFYGQLIPIATERLENDTMKIGFPANTPANLVSALTQALVVNPYHRLQSADAFLALLEGATQQPNILDEQQLESYRSTQILGLLERMAALEDNNQPSDYLEAFVHLAVVALICQDSKKEIPTSAKALTAFVGNLIAGIVTQVIEVLENADVENSRELIHNTATIGLTLLLRQEQFCTYLRGVLIEAVQNKMALTPVKRDWQVDRRVLHEKPKAIGFATAFPKAGAVTYPSSMSMLTSALTERGHYLLSFGSQSGLNVLHLPSGQKLNIGVEAQHLLASGGGAGLWVARDDTLELRSLNGQTELSYTIGEPITALQVAAQGVAFGTSSGRIGWLKFENITWLPSVHTSGILEVCVSSDERVIVAIAQEDARVALYRTDKVSLLREITLHSPAASISIEPGGRLLATRTQQGEVSVWDFPSGVQRRQIFLHSPALDLTMLHGGHIAILTTDQTVLLYAALSAEIIVCESLSIKASRIYSNPSGSLLCLVGSTQILAWQLNAFLPDELQPPSNLFQVRGTKFKTIEIDSQAKPPILPSQRLQGLSPLHRKLELYRTELLDLGTRNPLLNFQERDQSGRLKPKRLVLGGVTADALYQHLVIEEKGIVFESTLQPSPEDEDDQIYNPKVSTIKRSDLKVSVQLSASGLQTRLTELYRTAQEFIEEQGINCFYMVLGVVSWRDSKDPLQSRQAPLVLIPLTLTRERQGGAFRLTYSNEDIESNQAFALKLRLEGLLLPSIGEAEDFIPSDYAKQVEQSLGQKYGPVMSEQIYLGFFSFAKLLMYRDLDPSTWSNLDLAKHPILAPLLSDEVNPTPALPAEPARLEMVLAPSATGHVLDADYSQSQAVLLASQGHHLVIEGPPGTGKSQTITNIIAALLARGKKVLFVAEKEAALSVVEGRLGSVGLGEATLSLHSKDANKTALRDQLARAYNQVRVLEQPKKGEHQELDKISAELRELETALHTPVFESGLTPYDLFGLIRASDTKNMNAPSLTTGTEFKWTRAHFEASLNELDRAAHWLGHYGSPLQLPFYGSSRLDWLPTDDTQTKALVQRAELAIAHLSSQTLSNIPSQTCLEETNALIGVLQEIESMNLPKGLRPDLQDWDDWNEADSKLLKRSLRQQEITEKRKAQLTSQAWETDLKEWITILEKEGTQWYAMFLPKVYRAKKAITDLFLEPAKAPKNNLLEVAKEIIFVQRNQQEINAFSLRGKKLFGAAWQAEKSDFTHLSKMVERIKEIRENVKAGLSPAWHLGLYVISLDPQQVEALTKYKTACRELKNSLEAMSQHLKLQAQETFAKANITKVTWEQWRIKLAIYAIRAADFRYSIEWNQLAERLENLGLTNCLKAVSWTEAKTNLRPAFALEVYNQWLAKAFLERPALARFSHILQNDRVTRFQILDQAVIALNRQETLISYQKTLPNATAVGQVGVLRQEFSKQKRLKPIRVLMQEAGRAIQALKPVFMMSPLSIASFLPLEALEFDVVLFDEASQVRPADALGALLRAKQVIVVGDQKQLGPSNFFQKTSGDDPDNELEGDSLLDLFISRFGNNKRSLVWHYRSQHESLIQTSNEKYYNNQLVTFPSAKERSSELGLVYHHHPETIYEPGERNRVNRLEAAQVIQAVLQHAEHKSHESLAVVTFNISQKKEIERLLDKLINNNQLSAKQNQFLTAPSSQTERFVVKNIENVQGDERDVIMISVGTGFDIKHKLHERFGPLAQKDGGRRLNVLITRARKRCEVFANFLPHDLKIKSNGGLPGFRRFLGLAYDQTSALKNQQHTSEDALISEIANFLRQQNYEIQTLVGSLALSIDLAVKNPNGQGYLIGIDVDSPSEIKQMKSTRDMHRLRPEVLKKLGWKLHRIWSTNWYKSPEEQRMALLNVLVAAELEAAKPSPTKTQTIIETPAFISEETTQAFEPIKTQILEPIKTQLLEPQIKTMMPTEFYQMFEPTLYNGDLEFHQIAHNTIVNWILQILEIEQPIHISTLTRRLANKTGNSRTGTRIVAYCKDIIERGAKQKYWDLTHNTLSLPNKPIVVRNRQVLPSSEKLFEFVPRSEIETAVRYLVLHSMGIQRSELEAVIPKILGFDRNTSSINQIMQSTLEEILKHPDFVLQNEYITLAKPKEDYP
jgi:serine/threonine protein kinase/DNA polymerase III delta prime subunit